MKKISAVESILRLRCPRCRRGKVYAGLIRMNPRCSVCDLKFERESGYFIGSMYVSYGFATVIVGLALLLLYRLLPTTPDIILFGLGCLCLIPFVPLIIRYSRVIWMNIDRAFDA